ncbi:succinylglutamate desuccinylase [Stutzerimonas stutzeri]|uniref:Succinylglutamate desuccinylase n=1 Tax=Stutzerimonas stutzeri TaxID=316 RepID=A0A2S4AM70_STUST|nr:succinylglutamate desuccinylase [Stutzerimonas stutzeri]MCQ4262155.1 succinylglutamate desuccinylase [Stutzerimonas stutzeri]POH82586.1 succinylglutamate desuccinylase [Stutzerimonas stutzeri]
MLAIGKLLELTLAGREPCEKIQLTPHGVKLHWLADGALLVSPPPAQDQGLDLLLSAGIHGNELIPIHVLDRLIRALARGDVQPRARLLLLFANPAAMRKLVRQVEHDLNRLFCGVHADVWGSEAIRAAELEALVSGFFSLPGRQRRHYDLHSAMRPSRLAQFAICPWREGEQVSPEALARLQGLAIDGVLLQHQATSTFSAMTATLHGADAFTVELAEGKGETLPQAVLQFERGLNAMIEGRALPAVMQESPQLLQISREIIKRSPGFRLCVPADIENFAPLPLGSVLAEDDGKRWIVDEPGARILFPMADVAVGQRAALIVTPLEESEPKR